MAEFLVRHFIKDYENIKSSKVRTSYGLLASVAGIICNLILFLAKIVIGMVLNSIAVTADAFNNLSDATSSIIGFAGTKLANRPADQEHPFGHGRYEYVAALVVAFLVLEVGLTCMKSSFSKIIHPETVEFQVVLVIILGISIWIKVWLGLFNRKLGNRINSSIMKATSADAFGDVGITSATIVSVIVVKLTGINIDGYIGFVVSIFVLLSGVNILKDTIQPLLGVAISREDYERITQFVEEYDLIAGTHDLILHNYGPSNLMATIHAEVPHTLPMEQVHDVIDKIERDAKEKLGILLVIHMDPVAINDEEAKEAKQMVLEELGKLDEDATIHDFRMVKGEEESKLIFDLVVSHYYKGAQEEEFVRLLKEKVKEANQHFTCLITLEHSYVEGAKRGDKKKK
ncbi:cation diffusion facilitator family transporter [[Clostridium] polysaccharolyticum]|uniref:Cation diffusion facilitator family transporter n=1 Tax=[Clostridium] polysaccharolyticum TaxID=29364 RepID=A0A1H9ZAE6_9FIRM|nr:cation diffusion facilitator family transporter [[Clostridium] polysaccharolyticum]SES78576.1 cation diffusion facilitator family transporter [[Clostridium] polysaccharolyticum]